MSKSDIIKAIDQICEEKGIAKESVLETIAAALAVAYRKDFGDKTQNIQVEFDPETGNSRIFDVKEVVVDELYEVWKKERDELAAQREAEEKAAAEGKPLPKSKPAPEQPTTEANAEGTEEEQEPRYDPRKNVSMTDAQNLKKGAKEGDIIRTELFPPSEYGRMAAQTAKQVIIQKLREAERETLFNHFKGREGEVFTATVQRMEGRNVLLDIGRATAVLPPQEQIPRERYYPNERFKVLLLSVEATSKGPQITVSRAHPNMVSHLFSLEVPEISSGVIEIKTLAREAGSRSKIAVISNDPNIDPVGSCVGQRGARVQTVIAELGGEKVDIIEYNTDPVKFISQSLSPAKVTGVQLNEAQKLARVQVEEDQLSLAIGRAGQNVRLSSKLTGWKIDILKEEQQPTEKAAEPTIETAAQTPPEKTTEAPQETSAEKTEELKTESVTAETEKPVTDPSQGKTPETSKQKAEGKKEEDKK